MIRNTNLRGRRKTKQGVSPMDGVANLADIMLVFACGLMIALILHWDVHLPTVDIVSKDQLLEVHDMDDLIKSTGISTNYQSKGMVYEDTKTKKLYIISP